MRRRDFLPGRIEISNQFHFLLLPHLSLKNSKYRETFGEIRQQVNSNSEFIDFHVEFSM